MTPTGKPPHCQHTQKLSTFLLRIYANDENITNTEDGITMFFKLPKKIILQNAEELVAKPLRREDV